MALVYAGSTVGYTNGIYDSAQYFEAHNINVTQYTVNLTDAMRSSNGEAEAAGYGMLPIHAVKAVRCIGIHTH